MIDGLDVHVVRPDRGVDAAFSAVPGEVVAVVGPPGGGKSTLVRAIAGLDRHGGTVTLDGEPWDDHGRQVRTTPERRVGLVLAQPLLLPHLDVRTNIAVAIDAGAGGDGALAEADVWVDAMGLAEVGTHRATRLSLVQGQRASLARALAAEPTVVLMDEPLAALSGRPRAELRRLLASALRRLSGPAVVVCEDPVDAFALADRVVVLEGGTVAQEGDLRMVTRRPETAWVAANVGLNLYRGSVQSGTFAVEDAEHTLEVVTEVRGPALAAVRPRAVSLFRARPRGSPRNVWHGGVVGVDALTGRMRVSVVGRVPIVAEVTPAAAAELELGRGGGVWVSVKATDIEVLAD